MRQEKAALYTRVSTLDQSDQGQEEELVEFAERRGWEVGTVYRDKISGLKSRRPELDQLLLDAKRGHSLSNRVSTSRLNGRPARGAVTRPHSTSR